MIQKVFRWIFPEGIFIIPKEIEALRKEFVEGNFGFGGRAGIKILVRFKMAEGSEGMREMVAYIDLADSKSAVMGAKEILGKV